MLFPTGTTIKFVGVFNANKDGATGLTVTVTVKRGATVVVSGAAAADAGDGAYEYLFAAASNTTADNYRAIFRTADTSVDSKVAHSLAVVGQTWVQNMDATISSRMAAASYLAPANSDIATLVSRITDARATLLDNLFRLDTLVTTRMQASAYVAPDNTSIGQIKTKTDKLTFDVSNNVAANAQNLPSDYATTEDVTTITDAISTSEDNVIAAIEDGNAGTGPNVVTFTVTDGTNPIQGAKIAIAKPGSYNSSETNSSGVAAFGLETQGTYSYTVVQSGYITSSGTIVVNSNNTTKAVTLTVRVIPSPSDPNNVVIYGYSRNPYTRVPTPGTVVKIEMEYASYKFVTSLEYPSDFTAETVSDETGYWELECPPSSAFKPSSPSETTYALTEGTITHKIRVPDGGGNSADWITGR